MADAAPALTLSLNFYIRYVIWWKLGGVPEVGSARSSGAMTVKVEAWFADTQQGTVVVLERTDEDGTLWVHVIHADSGDILSLADVGDEAMERKRPTVLVPTLGRAAA